MRLCTRRGWRWVAAGGEACSVEFAVGRRPGWRMAGCAHQRAHAEQDAGVHAGGIALAGFGDGRNTAIFTLIHQVMLAGRERGAGTVW